MDLGAILSKVQEGAVNAQGARSAFFVQMAQFMSTAKPVRLFYEDATEDLQKVLDRVHEKGGFVTAVLENSNVVIAYMPKEASDG